MSLRPHYISIQNWRKFKSKGLHNAFNKGGIIHFLWQLNSKIAPNKLHFYNYTPPTLTFKYVNTNNETIYKAAQTQPVTMILDLGQELEACVSQNKF